MQRIVNRMDRPPEGWYVFYENLGEVGSLNQSDYWHGIKRTALDYFETTDLRSDLVNDEVVRHLRNMADVERKKELRLLKDYLGCTLPPDLKVLESELVNVLTENFSIKAEAENILKAVKKDAITGDFKYYSPKLIGDYIRKEVEVLINGLSNKAIYDLVVDDDATQYEREWSELVVSPAVERGIEEFMKAMVRDKKRAGEDASDTWSQILDLYGTMENFRGRMVKTAYQQYGLDSMIKRIQKEWKEEYLLQYGNRGQIAKQVKRRVVSQFRKDLTGKGKGFGRIAHTAGGAMLEELQSFIKGMLEDKNRMVKSNFKVTTNISPTRESIDVTTVLSPTGVEVDLTVLDRPTKDKQEAFEKYTEFVSNLQKGQETSIIYESTKLYGLGEGFKGFRGSAMTFDSAAKLLDSIGYDKGERLLQAINQTATGAILHQHAAGIRGDASHALAQHVAYFLFDDWKQIGKDPKGGPNTIHVFNLSFIILPLSTLLYRLADAMSGVLSGNWASSEINRYVDVGFTVPDILYKQYPQEKKSVQASEERWNKQMKAAKRSTMHVTFLRNFKDLIKGDFEVALRRYKK